MILLVNVVYIDTKLVVCNFLCLDHCGSILYVAVIENNNYKKLYKVFKFLKIDVLKKFLYKIRNFFSPTFFDLPTNFQRYIYLIIS